MSVEITEYACKFDPRCKCYSSNTADNCAFKNITDSNIPHFPKEVQKLFLNFNQMKIIPPSTFSHLETLIS